MRILTPGVVLAALAVLIAAETSQAAPFSRLRERRKEEMRSEIMSGLAGKLERDLATEVSVLTAKLHEVAVSQVQNEAKKLEAQVAQEVARLGRQAEELVTAEAARLGKEATAEIRQLRMDAQADLVAKSQELENQIQHQTDLLRNETAQLVKAESAIPGQVSQAVRHATAALKNEIVTDLTTKLQAVVATEVESVRVALKATPPQPAPSQDVVPENQESAIEPKSWESYDDLKNETNE